MKRLMQGMFVALGLAALPAAAAVTVTYTGTTFAGTDVDGIFVAPGGSLAGWAFTAVYTIADGATPLYNLNQTYVQTGSNFGAPAYISAVLTINGVSFTINGSYEATAQRACCAPAGQSGIGNYVSEFTPAVSHAMNFAAFSFFNDFTGSNDIASPLSANIDGSVNYDGFNTPGQGFFILGFAIPGVPGAYGNGANGAFGNFAIEHVTVAGSLAAVPEPDSWVMLIAGFGIVGATMRRRRSAAAIA